jgi:hypothetical protein
VKTLQSVSDEYDSRAYAETGPMAVPAVAARKTAKPARRAGWQKGDLLAVPVCILWGMGLWASSYGMSALAPGASSGAGPLSWLWSLPVAAVKYLFGW